MKFLLMCCFDDARWASLAEDHRAQIMQEYDQWVQQLAANGRYLGGGKLDESCTATTVRKRNSKTQLTDGPFSEAKEQVGGYHIIECGSREEAVRFAERVPTLPAGGTIEVRPLLKQLG